MEEAVKSLVREYFDYGVDLTRDEVLEIRNYCERKMERAGIQNRAEYFPSLFEDELRSYVASSIINVTVPKGGNLNVQRM